jgi:flagellar motor switch protein FliM
MDAPDQPASNAEVLTQADVERLLAQVTEQEAATTVPQTDAPPERRVSAAVQPYDFRQPAFLTANQLRKLRLRHEEFLRSLAARLSIYLRLEFAVQMSKLQTVLFQKFAESLPNPTHLTLFKVEPLRGICLLEIPRRLGLTIVDRLLGGPAQAANAERDLSEIEVTLLDQVTQIILREWCSLWTQLKREVRPTILGHESNGRFLETAARDAVMLVLAAEARMGDCIEQMQFGIPFYTLETLVRDSEKELEQKTVAATKTPARWSPEFNDVQVPVTALWPEQEVTLRDLSRLKVGDVLVLDERATSQVYLRLARSEKFAGRLGTRGKSWAVEITRPLEN